MLWAAAFIKSEEKYESQQEHLPRAVGENIYSVKIHYIDPCYEILFFLKRNFTKERLLVKFSRRLA